MKNKNKTCKQQWQHNQYGWERSWSMIKALNKQKQWQNDEHWFARWWNMIDSKWKQLHNVENKETNDELWYKPCQNNNKIMQIDQNKHWNMIRTFKKQCQHDDNFMT